MHLLLGYSANGNPEGACIGTSLRKSSELTNAGAFARTLFQAIHRNKAISSVDGLCYITECVSLTGFCYC